MYSDCHLFDTFLSCLMVESFIIQYSHNYILLICQERLFKLLLAKSEHNIVRKLLELLNYFTIFIHCY